MNDYSLMTDTELEHSMDRTYGCAREAVAYYTANALLEATRDSYFFDRLILGMDGDEKDIAWRYIQEVERNYREACNEARIRETDFDPKELDIEEMLEDMTENLQDIAFDRIGLSGIAKSVKNR